MVPPEVLDKSAVPENVVLLEVEPANVLGKSADPEDVMLMAVKPAKVLDNVVFSKKAAKGAAIIGARQVTDDSLLEKSGTRLAKGKKKETETPLDPWAARI